MLPRVAGSAFAGEMFLQRIEPALEDVGAHAAGDLVRLAFGRIELCCPFGERPVAIRHPAQFQR